MNILKFNIKYKIIYIFVQTQVHVQKNASTIRQGKNTF